MKVLITGASGFIGSNLAVDLSKMGLKVIAHRHATALPARVSSLAKECTGDITQIQELSSILEEHSPEMIIHAAAIAHAGQCEDSPELAESVNVDITNHLVSLTESLKKPPMMIFLSTDMVFEGKTAPIGGFKEGETPEPLSIYSQTKVRGEQMWLKRSSPGAIFRICLCFGPEIAPGRGMLSWMHSHFRQSKELHLFQDEWRTPVFTRDIAIAAYNALKKSRSKEWIQTEIFHLAGPQRLSRLEMGRSYAEVFQLDSSLIKASERKDFSGSTPRAEDVSLNNDRTRKFLSYSPIAFREGLEQIKA